MVWPPIRALPGPCQPANSVRCSGPSGSHADGGTPPARAVLSRPARPWPGRTPGPARPRTRPGRRARTARPRTRAGAGGPPAARRRRRTTSRHSVRVAARVVVAHLRPRPRRAARRSASRTSSRADVGASSRAPVGQHRRTRCPPNAPQRRGAPRRRPRPSSPPPRRRPRLAPPRRRQVAAQRCRPAPRGCQHHGALDARPAR